jgi:hypothetical protein
MRICGVELKSNEVNICLLSLTDGLFEIPDCRARRLTLTNINSRDDLIKLQFDFEKLMLDYKIEAVVIRERPMKGKFAGGAVGFKIEAALELIKGLDVEVFSATDIKASLKRNPVHIPFSSTGLKVFQETAFTTAFAYLMREKYADE